MRIALLIILMASSACSDIREDPAAAPFGSLAEVASIGSLEGPVIFGDIEDAGFGPSGSIFVLDQQAPSVVHVGRDGTLLGEYDAVGDGPGELRRPTELEPLGDSLLVFDPAGRGVVGLSVDGLQFLGATPVEGIAWDYCTDAGRSFVHGSRDGRLVAELGGDGRELHAFGLEPALPEGELSGIHAALIGQYRHLGKILCFRDAVLLFGSESPLVRRFTLDGEEIWRQDLADFNVSLYNTSGSRPTRDGERPFDVVVSAFPWDQDHVVIQVSNRGGDDSASLTSYLLSLETGREVARSDALPEVLAAEDGEFLGVEHEPFPRVMVLTR